MKNLLLGFLLGILVLKGSYSYYSYEWWTARDSLSCRIEAGGPGGIIPCMDRKMGNAKYFEYININLGYTSRQWQLE